METLPIEKIWEIALELDPNSLISYCQTNRSYADLCRSETFWKDYFKMNPQIPDNVESPIFWARKAEYDFGFPRKAFPLAGGFEIPGKDRYLKIQKMVPSRRNISLLNQMAPQWYQFNNGWNLQLDYPMDPTMYSDKNLHSLWPMTEEEADKFLDTLDDRTEESFIDSNHLYLHTDYVITYPYDRVFKDRVSLRSDRQTLVRGDQNDNITYKDILENTRNLFPSTIKSGQIQKYSWKGFSEDGIPILEVTIDF